MILRERFGMDWREAQFEQPEWYVDMLLTHHRAQQNAVLEAAARQAAEQAELDRTEQQLLQDMKAAGLQP